MPHQYLAYKASLLREAEREGGTFPRNKAKHMFRLKATSSLRVYDLLVASGWLAPSHPLPTGACFASHPVSQDNFASLENWCTCTSRLALHHNFRVLLDFVGTLNQSRVEVRAGQIRPRTPGWASPARMIT